MDLQSLYRTMVRRKLVVIPMILLVVAGLLYTYKAAPPVYKASGSIALANPVNDDPTPTEEAEAAKATPKGTDNPFLLYNDLTVIQDMVVRLVTSPSIDASMRQNGVVGTYAIGSADLLYRGPIIDVTFEAPSPAAARKSAKVVMAEIGHQLEVIQTARGTAKPYQIYTLPVVQPESATAVFSGTLRRLMMFGVLGAVAIVGSAIVADRLAERRTARRARRNEAGAGEPTTATVRDVIDGAQPGGTPSTPAAAADLAWSDGVAPGDPATTEPLYYRQREARRGNLGRPQRRSRSARS